VKKFGIKTSLVLGDKNLIEIKERQDSNIFSFYHVRIATLSLFMFVGTMDSHM